MDAALAFQRDIRKLKSKFAGIKSVNTKIAAQYNVSRHTVQKTLKLLELDDDVQYMVRAGTLPQTLALEVNKVKKESQKNLADKILREALTRDKVRLLVERINSGGVRLEKPTINESVIIDPNVQSFVEGIEETFGISINPNSSEENLEVVVKMWDRDIIKDLLLAPKFLDSDVKFNINIPGPEHELTRAIELNLSCEKSTDFNQLLGIVCNGFEMVKKVREMRANNKLNQKQK